MTITIEKCTVADIEADAQWLTLAREYSDECAILDLPTVEKLEIYRSVEASGIFTAYKAMQDDLMIGFCAVITPVILHYGVACSMCESIFIGKAHRASGAGMQLIDRAIQHAKDAGSPGLLVTAPSNGALCKLLPHIGFNETNRVFLKEFWK